MSWVQRLKRVSNIDIIGWPTRVLWSLWKNQRQNDCLYNRPCDHLQNINVFRQTRLIDYRQYLSSPAAFRTRANHSDWRLHHPKKFWLWRMNYKTTESLSIQYVEARPSTYLISNFSTNDQVTYLSWRPLLHKFLKSIHVIHVQLALDTADTVGST